MPQLGQIKSLSTDMDYKFTYSDDTSAFVYYDLVILKHDTSEKASYIVRVWLAKLGDAKSSSDNDAKPTQVTISDVVYDLYTGHNGNAPEYTFVVTMKTHNFHGNLMDFINYLTKAKSLDSSHYLATNLAGIQVFDSTQGTTTMSNFSASIQLA
ncbi:unnamed protein product [Peronospora belbahrii]|uniref:Uncharacterized protein n=1 Tax=Peronospora belbahrii TaxID=622444 RepID=A0AAU9KN94_9STRA|nr:unnamed protein product [Peronospora belbahrii]CAH0515113.1 unnamed protein product [Peronospora belbahrii]